jgi:hypothetical protein
VRTGLAKGLKNRKKRLVSLSFRSSYFEAQFSSDGLYLVIEGSDSLNWGQTIKTTVWETKEGKELLPIHCSFSYADVISSSTGLAAFTTVVQKPRKSVCLTLETEKKKES